MQMAKGLAVTGDLQAAADQIKGLYKLFDACDCTMVEVRQGVWGGGGVCRE
jgi:succinyl-CoA synthetase beta subunit